MNYTPIVIFISALVFCGCSQETTRSRGTTGQPSSQSSDVLNVPSAGAAESAAVSSSPKFEAVVVLNAAKNGKGGPYATSDMGVKGKLEAARGPLRSELSWKFIEHRDGSDHYKLSWSQGINGGTTNGSGLTVGFDGGPEATVINEEPYVVIRKGPLDARREEAK